MASRIYTFYETQMQFCLSAGNVYEEKALGTNCRQNRNFELPASHWPISNMQLSVTSAHYTPTSDRLVLHKVEFHPGPFVR